MSVSNEPRALIWTGVALLVSGVLSAPLLKALPGADPALQSARLIAEAPGSSLVFIQQMMTPTAYEAFVVSFAEPQLARARMLYDRVDRQGEAIVETYRARARQAAYQRLADLDGQIESGGRQAFTALPVTERMQLIENADAYRAFIEKAGWNSLPPSDQAAMGSAAGLRDRHTRERYVNSEPWRFLSSDEQRLLGSAETLVRGTPAFHAFVDRTVIPRLDEADRQLLTATLRKDLADPAPYLLRTGAPLAEAWLKALQPAAGAISTSCAVTDPRTEGSLLRGARAECTVQSGKSQADLHLIRRRGQWRIDGVTPPLTQILSP